MELGQIALGQIFKSTVLGRPGCPPHAPTLLQLSLREPFAGALNRSFNLIRRWCLRYGCGLPPSPPGQEFEYLFPIPGKALQLLQ